MYLNHFKAQFSDGDSWEKTMDVVLGASVARQLKMELGSHFHGTHGFEEEGHAHDEVHYNVVGVLKETGSVVDRLILTSTESVWDIHSGHSLEEEEEDREYTALLVKFKSPMGLMQLPRFINEKTSMQAALPAIEINRLYDLMGVGFSTLQAIGVLMMMIAAISVFVSLLNSLKERKQELALMRVLGASPSKLFGLVILESLLLCLVGYLIGIILGRVSLMVLSGLGEQQFKFGIEQAGVATVEIWLLPFTLSVGLIAAIIPAIRAYRSNISSTLKDG
jgi:putative ABC transport system permease protein